VDPTPADVPNEADGINDDAAALPNVADGVVDADKDLKAAARENGKDEDDEDGSPEEEEETDREALMIEASDDGDEVLWALDLKSAAWRDAIDVRAAIGIISPYSLPVRVGIKYVED
jgi:hypothetical protein